MRVLQIHTRYRQAGGEDTVLETERRLLTEAGHTVETHLEHNPEGAISSAAALAASPWNVAAVRRAMETARRFRPDVAHVHNTWFALSPAVFHALRSEGIPTVVTMHNYRLACLNAQLFRDGAPCEDCVGQVPWRGVVHRCYRGSAVQSAAVAATVTLHRAARTWDEAADVVVALSGFAADRLARSGVPRERIVVKDNVVEDPGPRPSPPSTSRTVLFVGRLSPEKGVADLLDVWRRSSPARLELVVVGDGPLYGELTAQAPPGVTIAGRKEPAEVMALLKGARALVFPSRWYEGQAMILLEALSAGTPVVFPELGPIPEVVGSGGFAFEHGRPDSLAAVIAGLGDGDAVDRAGRAARAEFEARFSPSIGLRRLLEVYRHAREGRPR